MQYLLDTHILIWLTTNDHKLSDETRKIVDQNNCCISSVSIWEVALKFSIGKLSLEGGLAEFLKAVNDLNFERIEITDHHLLELNKLVLYPEHKDPFDRLLIAQAKAERMKIVTNDKEFKKYDLEIIWN